MKWTTGALATFAALGLASAAPALAQYRQEIRNDPARCASGAGPAVQVTVSGIKSATGLVRVQSYRGTAAEWLKKGRWLARIEAPARRGTMSFCVPLPAAGTYAIAVRHDLNGSLTEIYQTHYDLIYTSMHLSFYPTSMPPQAAEALGVMEGRPALLLRRLNYDQHGRILDYDIEYWRHDSLRIEVDTH